MKNFLRENGDTAIDLTLFASPQRGSVLYELRVHLNAPGGAGDLTVSIESVDSDRYDTVLMSQDMTAVSDLHWQPNRPVYIDRNDKVRVQWANAGGAVYGAELVWFGM